MKKIIFSILFFYSTVFCNAQVVLETSGYPPILQMIHLEYSGFKYAYDNQSTHVISLYNLNHTLYKTINIPPIPIAIPAAYRYAQYVTETLWDTDSTDVDYAILGQDTSGSNFIRVFHENGTLIFSRDSASFYYGIGNDFGNPLTVPIINKDSGTKMILWCGAGHSTMFLTSSSVYCLAGHLECPACYNTTCDGQINGIASHDFSNQSFLSNPYPNPTNNTITLPFTLPDDERTGEIVLHNIEGIEINRYKVDRTFNTIILNSADLPSGTYFYQLITSKGISGGKKMIVIK